MEIYWLTVNLQYDARTWFVPMYLYDLPYENLGINSRQKTLYQREISLEMPLLLNCISSSYALNLLDADPKGRNNASSSSLGTVSGPGQCRSYSVGGTGRS